LKAYPFFTLQFEGAKPFYRDHRQYVNAPLEITERKYLLSFQDEENRHAVGLYNETDAKWEILPFISVEGEELLRYITKIIQTNYAHYYRIHYKNDSLDWNNNSSVFFAGKGGMYDMNKWRFVDDLYVSNPIYHERDQRDFLHPDGAMIRFPRNGWYVFYDKNMKMEDIPFSILDLLPIF
jgi:hypothetical protein